MEFLVKLAEFETVFADACGELKRRGVHFSMSATLAAISGETLHDRFFRENPLRLAQWIEDRFAVPSRSPNAPSMDASLDVLVSSLCGELDRRGVLDHRGVPYRDPKVRTFVANILRLPTWNSWPKRGPLRDAVKDLADRWQTTRWQAAESRAAKTRRVVKDLLAGVPAWRRSMS